MRAKLKAVKKQDTSEEYNPNWPFPQFNKKGERLLPRDWKKMKYKSGKSKNDLNYFEEGLF
jgi:hypothetical protein